MRSMISTVISVLKPKRISKIPSEVTGSRILSAYPDMTRLPKAMPTRKVVNMATITISDALARQAKLAAVRAAYSTPESLIEEAVEQRLLQLQAEESQTLTQRIRSKMQEKGITEAEILSDFEQFRQSLLQEEE